MSFELILPFLRPIKLLLLDDGDSQIMGGPDGLRGGLCESLTNTGQR